MSILQYAQTTVALIGVMTAAGVGAVPITFGSASASFFQSFDRNWSPAEMIDGVTSGANGWAIYRNNGQPDQTQSETALFTLAVPAGAGASAFTFTIFQNYGAGANSFHVLGDFSLAYTTAASPTLTSSATPMTITSAVATSGATFSSSSTGQLLVGGTLPATDVYTITASVNALAPITGIFLNVINDPASGLPTGGPGSQPSNGNFVLSEFVASVSAVPEPGSPTLMLVGLGGVGLWATRSRRG